MLFFHALSLLSPAPCVPVPPCHLLLCSMSSLIAVGLNIAAIGAGAIAGDAMGMCVSVLLCYCYFVTFCLYNEKNTALRNNIPY